MHFIPTPQQEAWIKDKVASGDYANASEVLRELLRQQMTRERKLQALREAIEEGEASGDYVPLDMENIKHRSRERWNREHADKTS